MKKRFRDKGFIKILSTVIIIVVAFSCTGCELEESPSTSEKTTKQDVQNTIVQAKDIDIPESKTLISPVKLK